MKHKKYFFIATLLMGVFISISVKCGTSSTIVECSTIKNNPVQQQDEYFQSNNLLFIKYSF
jgi:hypothetical protein